MGESDSGQVKKVKAYNRKLPSLLGTMVFAEDTVNEVAFNRG